MLKNSILPTGNEKEKHHWIKYEGGWLRFTENQIATAKEIAKNNKHEIPSIWERIKYYLIG
jgi:hypothetical protein